MVHPVCRWLVLSSFVASAAACTNETATDLADRVAAAPATISRVTPAQDAPAVFQQFQAEKARAEASELPDQF